MAIPIDPQLAANYRAIVEDENDPRGWDDVAKLADEQSSPSLAAYARAQAAGKGDDVTPSAAAVLPQNTRSKGIGKEPDGINEPPLSIDKTTPGTRFPTIEAGDVTPTSVDPTGEIDDRLREVSQSPSTAVDQVLKDQTSPAPAKEDVRSATKAAPSSKEDAAATYNRTPKSGKTTEQPAAAAEPAPKAAADSEPAPKAAAGDTTPDEPAPSGR